MIKSHDVVQKGVDRVGTWVHGSFTELKADMKAIHARLDEKESRDEARRPALPPHSECPPTTEDNLWKAGLTFMVSEEGKLLFGGAFDVRDVACFEFVPKDNFPVCWVRRRPDVRPREDKVRKEKPIMSQARAQDVVMELAEKGEFVNMQFPAFSRSYMTFHQPENAEMPFTSKALEAATKALAEGRPTPPPLDEVANTSMLVPFPAGIWENVAETFVPRQLEKDAGVTLFGEPCLANLSKALVDQEFECRARLSDTLHMQTMMEASMLETFGTPMQNRFMMMAKLHLRMFLRDLYAFLRARKACREHVLSKATVRHEPEKLINSSPWGKNLFPQKLVDEVRESLVSGNTTLAARWKIPAQGTPKTTGQGSGQQQQQQKRKPNPTQGGAQHPPKRGRGAYAAAAARAAPPVQQTYSASSHPYSTGMFWGQLDPVSGYHSLTPVSTAPPASTSGAAFQGSPFPAVAL